MEPTTPDWITAWTGLGTLLAAIAAGIFAWRAAVWTKAQAQAAQDQLKLDREALELARQDAENARALAEDQRQEARRTARFAAETRADAMMPTVLARATPGAKGGRVLLEIQRWSAENGTFGERLPVSEPLVIEAGERALFRTNVTIHVTNHSQQIGHVAVVDPARGEVDVRSGDSVLLGPGETKDLVWWRYVGSDSLRTVEDIDRPEHWLMDVRLWVRDLGMTTYDVVVFNADLRFFTRDGSRLLVQPEPAFPWSENVGQPLPDRVYDRLDVAG